MAASAKLARETVASVRAVCDLSLIAPAVQQITDAWRSQTALPAARFRPDAPALAALGVGLPATSDPWQSRRDCS